MTKFEREDRYIVLKRKDLAKLSRNTRTELDEWLSYAEKELPKRSYVVVESDWPEYEAVFKMIEARVTGEPMVGMEPVMIYHGECTIDCGEYGHHNMEMLKLIPAGTKLYTQPKAPEPLTDEQIDNIIKQHTGGFIGGMHFAHLARAIEAAHGIGAFQ